MSEELKTKIRHKEISVKGIVWESCYQMLVNDMPWKSQKKNHSSIKLIENKMFENKSKSTSQSSSSEDFDSPYKNSLGKIKYIDLKNDGEDDFSTPVKIIPKIIKQLPKRRKTPIKKRSKLKQSKLIVTRAKDNVMHLDVNPEHLLTALALSKSTFENEYPSTSTGDSEPSFLNPNEIPNMPTLLERYGFKTSKLHPHEIFLDRLEAGAKRKMRKFRYVTPILHMRTSEERESLINSKIKLLLSQQKDTLVATRNINLYTPSTYSTCLQQYVQGQKCWEINAFNEYANYTCPSLNISPTKCAVGYLLKDWDDIPGRKNVEKMIDQEDQTEQLFNKQFENQNQSDTVMLEHEIDNRIENVTCRNDNMNKKIEGLNKNKNNTILKHISDNFVDSITCNIGINIDKELENLCNKDCSEVNDNVGNEINNWCRMESASPDLFNSDDEFESSKSFCNDEFKEVPSCSRSNFNKEISTSSHFNINDELTAFTILNDTATNLKHSPNTKMDILQSDRDTELNITTDIRDERTSGINHFQSFSKDASTLMAQIMEEEAWIDLTQGSDEEVNNEEKTSQDFCFKEELNELNPEVSSQTPSTCSGGSIIEINDKQLNDSNKSDELVRTTSHSEERELEHLEETEKDYCLEKEQFGLNPDLSSQSQSTCSQNSIIELSDEELNYSNKFSVKQHGFYDLTNFNECSRTDIDKEEIDAVHLELKNKYSQEKSVNTNEQVTSNNEEIIIGELSHNVNCEENKINNKNLDSVLPADKNMVINNISPIEKNDINQNFTCSEKNIVFDKSITTFHKDPSNITSRERSDIATTSASVDSSVVTPNKNLIIKTNNVTPMADYDNMDTPTVRAELDKFGIKPLKRRRGIQLLKYIYETTHPFVDDVESINEEQPVKRRKLSSQFENNKESIKIVGESIIQCEKEDELIFERKCPKKILSCRLPLQIAWYNFLCCNPSLAENVVLYEPIHLEVIHSMLKEQSRCNFHVEDLITFLDKKCITFRTNQWKNGRGK